MNWKHRLTNYNFWISLVSAVLLIFQAFNIKFDIVYINEIATAVLGLLVVIGIISDPTKVAVKEAQKQEDKENIVSAPEQKEKKVENQEEKKEDVIIPVETTNENNFNVNQDDFKAIIEKISADLHNLTLQTQATQKEEIKITEKEEPKQTEVIQTFNIVN